MAHCIKEHDKGAIGFTSVLGETWHGIQSYKHFDEAINIEQAERVVNYEVVKVPLFMQKTVGDLGLKVNKKVPKAFCLYRTDVDTVLYPNVGESYEIISNMDMLKYVEGLFADYGNLKIESIGTLNNGQNMFVNINVVNHTVKGDISPTVTRLMFTNSYGGSSLTACLHQTRIVCMNTLRIAEAQGKANDTLKRFRHTKNVSNKVSAHVIDLAAIVGEVNKHNEKLDYLATKEITPAYMDSFLENMFPSEGKDGASKSIAENKKSTVLSLYGSKDDLTALSNNRYRLFNAITDYTSHSMSITKADDQAKRFMNVAHAGGAGDKVNQKALQLLTLD